MKIIKTYFENKVLLITPKIFKDNRGYFFETYNKDNYSKIGIKKLFIQDNYSYSKNINTFRGIHIQLSPYGQEKLIRVFLGSLIDYVIDLRLKSKTFGKYVKIILNDKNHHQLYIPEGFGHAFLTTKKNTVVNYKVSKKYFPNNSISIAFNDKKLNIDYDIPNNKKFIISNNDKKGISIDEFKKLLLNRKKVL